MRPPTEKETRLDLLIEEAYEHAARVIVGTENQLLPTFFLFSAKGNMAVGCPWENQPQKEAMVARVRRLMKKEKAHAYSFVTEAWTAPQRYANEKTVAPMHRPDRKEVVLAFASNKTDKLLHSWEIERDWTGRCTKLIEQGPTDYFVSWFLDLL